METQTTSQVIQNIELVTSEVWEPNPKQIDFAQVPFDIFEGFYGGALGGGKSELLLMLPILYGFHLHSKFHGIFFRRTLSQQDETLILRARFLYGKVGGTFNEQKRIFTFPSGAIIRFAYLERDEHARDHDGAEYHYVAFDELTHFTEFQYIYITSRIRRAISDLPVIIRSASNPGNIGHAWVRKRFIEPYKDGGKLLKDEHGNYRIFIRSFAKDNPHLTKNDPLYMQRLQMLPEHERRAKVEGDWWIFAGQVFTDFRPEKIIGEPDNALHVIPPFEIPYYWPRLLGIDWGHAANTWVGWAAISPEKRFYLYREFVIKGVTIKKWATEVFRLSLPEIGSIKSVIVDPSAWKNEGHEQSIIQQIQSHLLNLGPLVEKADNARLSGKLLIHDLLRFKPIEKPKNITPGGFNQNLYDSLLRNFGPKAATEYAKSFTPEVETSLPRLQIFNTCEEIIRVLPLCVYNEDKGSRTGKKYEDVAEFNGDDAYDGFRYLCKGVDRYIEEVMINDEEFKRMEAIENHRKSSGDETSYYIRMAMLEAEKRKAGTSISVSRGRNRR